MRYKEVKLDSDKSVLVDESAEMKEGDAVITDGGMGRLGIDTYQTNVDYSVKPLKIVASINHSIILDVPMVTMEDEVEKLANTHSKILYTNTNDKTKEHPVFTDYTVAETSKEDFKDGYKAVQQKGIYSEEVVKAAIDFGANLGLEDKIGNSFQWTKIKDEYIQSLKQEYIELEMEEHTEWIETNQGQTVTPITYLKIKTDRVDGQLMAYLKK